MSIRRDAWSQEDCFACGHVSASPPYPTTLVLSLEVGGKFAYSQLPQSRVDWGEREDGKGWTGYVHRGTLAPCPLIPRPLAQILFVESIDANLCHFSTRDLKKVPLRL